MAKRTKHQMQADAAITADLYIKGWLQADIAEHLSSIRDYAITQQTVSNDIKRIQKTWIERTTMDLTAAKAEELARVNKLEQTYWEQYEASLSDETITKAITDKSSDGTRYEATKKSRTGDAKYLQGVERCIQLRMKLLGLEAALKMEHTGKNGGAMEFKLIYPDDA